MDKESVEFVEWSSFANTLTYRQYQIVNFQTYIWMAINVIIYKIFVSVDG